MITKRGGGADAALRATGKRLTRARRLILESVRSSDAHPSAAMVYRSVRRRLPRVSLATVYRNLRMLAAEGLLSERTDVAGLRFDGNTATHDHFTCLGCGRVFDVPSRGARPMTARLAAHVGFEILSRRVEFYGRCGRCRRTVDPPSHATWRSSERRRGEESRAGAPPQRRTSWQAEASRAARVSRT